MGAFELVLMLLIAALILATVAGLMYAAIPISKLITQYNISKLF